jgi:hypothetical protein
MIYLKFSGSKQDGPINQRVICTNDYCVAPDDNGLRVYYQAGMWERLSEHDWLNCFVMSESGKTIDRLEAPA